LGAKKGKGSAKMPRIIVLGAGRVGRVIARDLAEDNNVEVTMADRRQEVLDDLKATCGCNTIRENLANPELVRRIVGEYDLVIGALPGALGFGTLSGIIAAGKPFIDTSFMPEDPSTLNKTAISSGAKVLYDFGTAPGISNIIAAWSCSKMKEVKEIRVMAGGLPVVRQRPWEYAAPFSVADVVEEYVRPARVKVAGEVREYPALSMIERLDVPGIGTLEAFVTDNLRSMLKTLDCPNMVAKTLRYPGHAKRINVLKNAGLLDDSPVHVKGSDVSPKDLVLAKLESTWALKRGMEDFTLLKVDVEGSDGKVHRWRLFDRSAPHHGFSSVARTTGFPTAIVARMFLDGTVDLQPGVHPPEALAANDSVIDKMREELKTRGVEFGPEDD